MSRMNRTFARGRASLLAGSMFATTALAGLGGLVGTVILSPGAALAAECTPDAPGQTGPGSATVVATANAVEDCGPEFTNVYGTGINYDATSNGNFTVIVGGAGA